MTGKPATKYARFTASTGVPYLLENGQSVLIHSIIAQNDDLVGGQNAFPIYTQLDSTQIIFSTYLDYAFNGRPSYELVGPFLADKGFRVIATTPVTGTIFYSNVGC